MNPEWLDVLKKVKSGELSVDEAANRLSMMDAVQGDESASVISSAAPRFETGAEGEPPDGSSVPDLGWWKNAWMVPFWIGTGIFILGAGLMAWAYSSTSGTPNFWFYCSWLPMLLGLLVLFLGWWSRQARWVHVRIQDSDGSKVNISMPLPLRLAGWFLRAFGPMIPAVKEQKLDFLPDIFDAVSQTRDPIWVDVDDEDGDRVKVYIV
jgi:hypothetical protein